MVPASIQSRGSPLLQILDDRLGKKVLDQMIDYDDHCWLLGHGTYWRILWMKGLGMIGALSADGKAWNLIDLSEMDNQAYINSASELNQMVNAEPDKWQALKNWLHLELERLENRGANSDQDAIYNQTSIGSLLSVQTTMAALESRHSL